MDKAIYFIQLFLRRMVPKQQVLKLFVVSESDISWIFFKIFVDFEKYTVEGFIYSCSQDLYNSRINELLVKYKNALIIVVN